jgi:hypothetical protein
VSSEARPIMERAGFKSGKSRVARRTVWVVKSTRPIDSPPLKVLLRIGRDAVVRFDSLSTPRTLSSGVVDASLDASGSPPLCNGTCVLSAVGNDVSDGRRATSCSKRQINNVY